jgi:hypothetical protein
MSKLLYSVQCPSIWLNILRSGQRRLIYKQAEWAPDLPLAQIAVVCPHYSPAQQQP